jgi:hypothetical protein
MSFSIETVHQYVKAAGQGQVRLAKTQAYIRMKEAGDVAIFLCSGRFWSVSGKSYKEKDVPGWAWQQAAACTDEALKEAGCDDKRIDYIRDRAAGKPLSDGVKSPTSPKVIKLKRKAA